VLGEYKAGRSPILVATDVVSRELGMFCFDFRDVMASFIHNGGAGLQLTC
jgi:superfamily II DNA/RNA helicase